MNSPITRQSDQLNAAAITYVDPAILTTHKVVYIPESPSCALEQLTTIPWQGKWFLKQ